MFCGGGGSNPRRGGPNPLADMDRGVQIRGGSKSAVTPANVPNTIRRLDNSRNYTLDDIVATSLLRREVATKSQDFNRV